MAFSTMSSRAPAPAALRASARRSGAARGFAARAAKEEVEEEAPRRSGAGKSYMLSLPGVTAPLGFFDPAAFCDAPTFTVSEAKRFREAELTHGRVASAWPGAGGGG